MDIIVERNGYNISNYVLSYTRDHDLCSGIGTLQLIVDPTSPVIQPGDTIKVYESGSLEGTFYTHTIAESPNKGIIVNCQDDSQFMQTYFEPTLEKTNGASSRYWISWVLDRAKVSYNFTTAGYGYTLPPDDQLGFETAYDIVMRMCQQSGWYFYFSPTGVCQIGSLSQNWHSSDGTIDEANKKILKEQLISNDERLRNKVIVWGGHTTEGESSGRVYTTLETKTPWDRDAKDKRTIVFANHFIHDYGTAWSLGKKLLDEHSKTLSVKLYQIAGYVQLTVGNTALCRTRIFKGVGRVTGIQASVSPAGFVTTVIIDERCPRIFGYWNSDSEYVYAGTNGSGVWRKLFNSSTWTNFSTGLSNLTIKDLKIKNGFFACTTDSYQVFTRLIDYGGWNLFSPDGFVDANTDTEYDLEDLVSAGCGMDENTGNVYFGYNHLVDQVAWVVELKADETYSISQVYVNDDFSYKIIDTDYNNKNVILSVDGIEGTGYQSNLRDAIDDLGGQIGKKKSTPHNAMYTQQVSLGPESTETLTSIYNNTEVDDILSSAYMEDNNIYLLRIDHLEVINHDTGASTIHTFGTGLPNSQNAVMYKESDDKFHFIQEAIHYTYVISTDTMTTLGTVQFSDGSSASGGTLYENLYFAAGISSGNKFQMVKYNVLNSSSIRQSSSTSAHGNYDNSVVDYVGLSSTGAHIVAVGGNRSGMDWWIKLTKISMSFSGSNSVATIELGSGTNSGSPFFDWPQPSVNTTYLGADKTTGNCYFRGGGFVANNDVDEVYDLNDVVTFPAGSTAAYDRTLDISGTPHIANPHFYSYARDGGSISSVNIFVPLVGREGFGYTLHTSVDGYSTTTKRVTQVNSPGSYVDASWVRSGGGFSFNYYGSEIDGRDHTLVVGETGGVFGRDIRTGYAIKEYEGVDEDYNRYFTSYGRLLCWNTTGIDKAELFSNTVPTISGGGDIDIRYQALKSSPVYSGGAFAPNFNITKIFDNPLQLEISRESPIVFFGGVSDAALPPRGLMECYATPTAASGTFVDMLTTIEGRDPTQWAGYVPDLRIGDVLGLASSISGWAISNPAEDYARYLFATQIEGEVAGYGEALQKDVYNIHNHTWRWFDTFSGVAWRIETTNYTGNTPYIFISTSGAPSRFWQLDPGEDVFNEHSAYLPSSNITVIRADDRI